MSWAPRRARIREVSWQLAVEADQGSPAAQRCWEHRKLRALRIKWYVVRRVALRLMAGDAAGWREDHG
jgi:hypothetical protein